jgi:tetratricopeptide (TPR) repeat protein
MLMVFDDMQQMDPASKDVLSVLARRIAGAPVLLLAGLRTVEQYEHHSAQVESGGLRWDAAVATPPLTNAIALRIIDSLCNDLSQSDSAPRTTIAEFALGNPYLIEMLVSDWKRHGTRSLASVQASGEYNIARWRPPETMRRAFRRQYQALSSDAERMLHLLAVARRHMPVPEIASLIGAPMHHTDQAALELIGRGIIRVDGDNLGFKNELHRAFVYYAMSDGSRTYHHASLARALRHSRGDPDFQRGLEASLHFLNAGMITEAADAVGRTAEVAIAQGAANEVERALTAVLGTDIAPQPDRLNLLLAQSMVAQGKYRVALDTLLRIDSSNLAAARDRAIVLALRAAAAQRGGLTDAGSVLATVSTARAQASAHGTEADRMGVYQITAEAAYESGDLDLLAHVKAEVTALGAASTDTRVRTLASLTAGYCMLVSGEWRDAIHSFTDFLRAAESNSSDPEYVRVLNGLGMALSAVGRYRAAETAYRRAAHLSNRMGNTQGALSALSNLGVLYDDLAMFRAAAVTYQRALELADVSSAPRRLVDLHTNMAGLAISLGNLAEAKEFIQQATQFAQDSGHLRLGALVYLMETNYHLARSDPEAAWSSLGEAERLNRGRFGVLDNPGLYWLVKSYQVWARYGRERMHLALAGHAQTLQRASLAHRIPVQLLVEWIDSKGRHLTGDGQPAMDVVVQRSLYGVVAAVVAVGAVPDGLPDRDPGESPAQFVCRVFLDGNEDHVPPSVTVQGSVRK